MFRRVLVFSAAAIVAVSLAGCTPGTPEQPDPTPRASENPTGSAPAVPMPVCADVTTALDGLEGSLAYDEGVSQEQLVPEAFAQTSCIYVSADQAAQLGVTISNITFQPEELESYRGLPTVIADDRATAIDAILQTSALEDGMADHLDSTLLLYDTVYSIAIHGVPGGEDGEDALPQLTVAAAADAAFAIRAIIG
jgi:hypothetical protein